MFFCFFEDFFLFFVFWLFLMNSLREGGRAYDGWEGGLRMEGGVLSFFFLSFCFFLLFLCFFFLLLFFTFFSFSFSFFFFSRKQQKQKKNKKIEKPQKKIIKRKGWVGLATREKRRSLNRKGSSLDWAYRDTKREALKGKQIRLSKEVFIRWIGKEVGSLGWAYWGTEREVLNGETDSIEQRGFYDGMLILSIESSRAKEKWEEEVFFNEFLR